MSSSFLTERQREIAAANARVVGNTPLAVQPFPCPVGLEKTQGQHPIKMPAYKNCFFGAEREWQNDEDGWQTIRRHKKRRARKAAE